MRSFTTLLKAVLLFLAVDKLCAQTNGIVYTYDAGGKMTQRNVQVVFSARLENPDNKDSAALYTKPIADLKIYPNPTNQFLNIEGALPEHCDHADIRLMNISGQILKNDFYTGSLKTLDVSGFKPGIYVLQLQYSKNNFNTYKVIITN